MNAHSKNFNKELKNVKKNKSELKDGNEKCTRGNNGRLDDTEEQTCDKTKQEKSLKLNRKKN